MVSQFCWEVSIAGVVPGGEVEVGGEGGWQMGDNMIVSV